MTVRPIDPESRRRSVSAAVAPVSVLALLLVLIAMVPMVSAAENNFTQVNNRDIIIKIFNPNENELVIMGDIAKPEYSIVVLGKIISQYSIGSLEITNGKDERTCSVTTDGKKTFSCELPVDRDTAIFSLTVTDIQGNRATKTRNFTPHFGLPPPTIIYAQGSVVDTKVNPVPDVSITFENSTREYNLVQNTITDDNGKYSIRAAYGYHQKITVQKEGYQTIVREKSFEMNRHDINFTLHPQSNQEYGLGFFGPVAALVILAMVASLRKEGL